MATVRLATLSTNADRGPDGLRDLQTMSNESRAARSTFRTALVTMPFVLATRPSIQIGLLSAIADSCGFPTDTFHLTLDAKATIGKELYEAIADFRSVQLGDWLFSIAAFGDDAPDRDNAFLHDFANIVEGFASVGGTHERLIDLRWNVLPDLADRLAREIPWNDYRVVGFTTSFQQSVASYALARRIKERFPDVLTLVGGSNVEGDMGEELMRAMPSFDLGITGEADRAFPELLLALSEGRSPQEVGGVLRRANGAVVPTHAQRPFERFDELPTPKYDEFYARGEAIGVLPKGGRIQTGIPFESARGCWWGAKHHCTFCGLNGTTMKFRAKSPERVHEELAELVRRYRSYNLYAVDNIVDLSYFKTLFPRLVEEHADYNIFYEVKSNLTRAQLKLLANAGVRRIQPGIESLSSHVLALMRKGVTGIQNVNLLRWCRYYGISVGWATIWGFPGETQEDAAYQAELFPKLVHLYPPGGVHRIWLERFSPLFFDQEKFPAEFRRAEPSYAYAYPVGVDFDKLAYFFDYALHNAPLSEWYEPVRIAADAWKERATQSEPPMLAYRWVPGLLQIVDTRRDGDPTSIHLEDEAIDIYLACSDEPRTLKRVCDLVGAHVDEGDVLGWLEEFCEQGLMMREGEKFLSLAIPMSPGR